MMKKQTLTYAAAVAALTGVSSAPDVHAADRGVIGPTDSKSKRSIIAPTDSRSLRQQGVVTRGAVKKTNLPASVFRRLYQGQVSKSDIARYPELKKLDLNKFRLNNKRQKYPKSVEQRFLKNKLLPADFKRFPELAITSAADCSDLGTDDTGMYGCPG